MFMEDKYREWEQRGWRVEYDAKYGAVRASKPVDPSICDRIEKLCRMREERKSRTWKAELLKVVQNAVNKIVSLLKVRE
jgi:hypothetical protein